MPHVMLLQPSTLDTLMNYQLTKTDQEFFISNKTTVRPLGRCNAQTIKPKNNKRRAIENSVAVDCDSTALMRSIAMQPMELV